MKFSPLLLLSTLTLTVSAAEPVEIPLWKGLPPGDKEGALPPEEWQEKAGDPVVRIANVSTPLLTIYPAENPNGAAVLVCPGGGYNILAYTHEGTRVCEWLNQHGVTAGLLKYRVPRRPGREPHEAPLQDAQRAMAILRSKAADYKIDPARIGVLGFSAGGNLAALALVTRDQKSYPADQPEDKESSEPNFAILVYPAYMQGIDQKEGELAPVFKVDKPTGPVFFAHSGDDPFQIEGSMDFAKALRAAGSTCELHLYATGGHGFGIRDDSKFAAGKWPQRAAEWMEDVGLLKKK